MSTVREAFGTWNAAIAAAGFAPRQTGTRGRAGEDLALCREIADRYLAGESTTTLAEAYDCASSSIRYRLHKAGVRLRSASEAQRLRYGVLSG